MAVDTFYARVAQLEEHGIRNAAIVGSNPTAGFFLSSHILHLDIVYFSYCIS